MNTADLASKQSQPKNTTRRVHQIFVYLLCCSVTLLIFQQTSWAEGPSTPTRLIAAGSGVNLAITRQLVKAFSARNPNITIEVPGSIGTKGAIEAANQGAITLGLISRPLNDKEKTLGLTVQPYAHTPIVLAVHADVPDNEMSTQDLIDIFKGTKTRWSNGSQIIVQARDRSDSGYQVLQEHLQGFKAVYQESHENRRWTVYFNDQDANQALANTPSSLGVTDLGMISTESLPIKALKLNGIHPSLETITNGTYPLNRTLAFIYRDEFLTAEAKAFLLFVSSPEGKEILQTHHYIQVQ